jgi:hypothetical protein
MTPSAPPRSPVEAARAAGMRWQYADRWFAKHQNRCRLYQAGRFCWRCNNLEVACNLTSRAYSAALDEARRATTQTATPIAGLGYPAKASESNEGGTLCEIRPAPLTASSKGKDDFDVIAGRAGEPGQQCVTTGPSLEGTTASGRAFSLNEEDRQRLASLAVQ